MLTSAADSRAELFAAPAPLPRPRGRLWLKGLLLAALLGNGAAITWLWLHGGGIGAVHSGAALWTSIGRVTGLFAVYLALVQVVLLSRLPPLERLVGFDVLTVWHRRNGMACIVLVVVHVVLITIGYAGTDRVRIPTEIMIRKGHSMAVIPSRRFAAVALAGSALAPLAATTAPYALAASTKTYHGPSVAMRWGNVAVTIRVSGKKVINLSATYPTERARSAFINSGHRGAITILRSETLKAQSASINAVGGATLTSEAFALSLSSALKAAHV